MQTFPQFRLTARWAFNLHFQSVCSHGLQEVDLCQSAILLTEEVLLEALCFDFVVDSPHAELLDLFESLGSEMELREYAWSLAHYS